MALLLGSWRKSVSDCTSCTKSTGLSTERDLKGLDLCSMTWAPNGKFAQDSPFIPFSNFQICLLKKIKGLHENKHHLKWQQTWTSAPWSLLRDNTEHHGKGLKSKREIKWIHQKSTKWRGLYSLIMESCSFKNEKVGSIWLTVLMVLATSITGRLWSLRGQPQLLNIL